MKVVRTLGVGFGVTGIVLLLWAASDYILYASTRIPFGVGLGLALMYSGIALVFLWAWLGGGGHGR